ncbi:MAG: double-strand break repair helicase AddA [Sphingorhabdus sp.]
MTGDEILHPLTDDQLDAVKPDAQVWLRASAGTGKTQVLTARVIRLLLTPGVKPQHLLCITFTKAGAAEMSERINGLLARWVQMKGIDLATNLLAIGADHGPESQQKARSLFASVLDAPGGGLQVMTIHSLAQSLLGSFPEEAGLIPGFKPVEGREQDELYAEALSELVLEAEEQGRGGLISHIQGLSLALGEEGALKFLKKCASQPAAMESIPEDKGAIKYARHLAGVAFDGPIEAMLTAALGDDAVDVQAIRALAAKNADWGKKSARGRERADTIASWLELDLAGRAKAFETLHRCWTKGDGEPLNASRGYTPLDESYAELALGLYQWSTALMRQVKLAEYAERLAPALLAGQAYARRYLEAKKARGLVDFDDMIRKTAELLEKPGMGQWIRFKLDSRIDHILVDESQDTNRAQWDIVDALSDDFFSGLGAKDALALRTIFSVGDEKQAIFGFQGTDPQEYRDAGERFGQKIKDAGGELLRLSLDQSFRSTRPILDAVNAVFGGIDEGALGDIGQFHPHVSELPDSGSAELMFPITSDHADAERDEEWISGEKRLLAKRIADKVAALVADKPVLSSTGKPLRPGDIMILLRRRGEIASYLVSQLHARKVAVAGIDRLKMQEPLVVQDMLAAIRFVLQPSDNYSLACLLVSPLIGWNQKKLLKHGYREKAADLWDHLRDQPDIAADIEQLRDLLGIADFTTAHAFCENLLSGEMQGRKKFAARLGSDALIPMEEMLNLALQFEQQGGGMLQNFLHWFESGETEIKREMLPGSDEVRVMTVHGAKGLQAPVVILADVTADPTKKPDRSVTLKLDGDELPLLNIRKEERFGRLDEAAGLQEEREAQEHLRLLYVAMTRAQEHLIMAGSLNDQQKAKGIPPQSSWYPHVEAGMTALGCEWEDDADFPQAMRHESGEKARASAAKAEIPAVPDSIETPDWLLVPAPEETRPPRPLVPSQIGDDDYGEPPAGTAMQLAAERGRLAHMLFERISGGDAQASLAQAEGWLSRQKLPDGLNCREIASMVADVVRNPEYADWFGPDARAEVPLAAVVGETVISGRVDRLLVTKDRVCLLDFKTGRNVPKDASGVPAAFLKQMAHYVAALEVIFPDHTVEASLLYSFEPRYIALPPALLTPHRPES